MTTVSEVAPDVFRISTYVPEADLEFGQFLVRDEEPLLFETGMKALFPAVRDAVAKVLDPATIRWVSFSHFESDECGSLNEWLSIAPRAQPACSLVGAASASMTSRFGLRVRSPTASPEIGKRRSRFHIPACRTAGRPACFRGGDGTLFCTDLLQQNGERPPLGGPELVELSRQAMINYQRGRSPLPAVRARPMRRSHDSPRWPKTLATMRLGLSRDENALREFAAVVKVRLRRRAN
jgi:hypothetical protein